MKEGNGFDVVFVFVFVFVFVIVIVFVAMVGFGCLMKFKTVKSSWAFVVLFLFL